MSYKQQIQFPKKIIYIMGPGRCGTTLLEVLLSNNNNISSCGELSHIFRDGFISNHRCSCGDLTCDCKEWSLRLKKLKWNQTDLSYLAKLFSFFSSHVFFPLVFLGLIGNKRRVEYAIANEALFSSIAITTQSNVIVDSSKYAGRAIQLAEQYPDKVYVLAMTRSPAGVLHSFAKIVPEQEPKSTLSAMLYYCYVLLCMRLVSRHRGVKCRKISYELLCASPLKVLSEIEAFCGINLEQSKGKIELGKLFKMGHIVTGNRIRHQNEIKFRCDSKESKISVKQRLTSILMGCWRRLLGF